MGDVILALLVLSIEINAILQMKSDPRFTREVILLYGIVITIFLIYVSLGALLLIYIPYWHHLTRNIQIFISISAFIIWNIIGLVFFMKYLSKILKAEELRKSQNETGI
jgi:hypothetical protein